MNAFDKLTPRFDVVIEVGTDYLLFDFARIPPAELEKEIATLFDRPGFSLRSLLHSELKKEGNFPQAYDPIEVADAIVQVCSNHGIKAGTRLTELLVSRMETAKGKIDP